MRRLFWVKLDRFGNRALRFSKDRDCGRTLCGSSAWRRPPPDPLPLRGGGKRMRATVVVINRNVNSVILGTIAILNSIQDRPATRERL